MGVPSVGILLHEMIKLMYHAKCKDPIFIRIGTCGGIGVEGGTVVITEEAVDGLLRNSYELVSYHSSSARRQSLMIRKYFTVDSRTSCAQTSQTG